MGNSIVDPNKTLQRRSRPALFSRVSETRRPKIACVMLSARLGGLEQSLVDYCEALLAERHPIEAIVHPRWPGRQALERLPLAALADLRCWHERDPLAVHRLRGRLSASSPDVVLTIGRRAAVLTRRARQALAPLPQVGVTPNYSIAPLVGLDHVIATTEDLRRALLAAGQPAERITVVPNLVRVPAQVTETASSTPPVIGALGRLIERKGFADLLEAAALLAARGYRFELRLGGSGPEQAALETLARRLGLAAQVRFPGWVADQRAFFAGLDVFCVPSRQEPFGIVMLEAMAHARALVATAAAGPREIVSHGVDGLLVPPGDPPALAAALAALLDDPSLRARLARAGRETARARYDLPVVARQISAVLCRMAPLRDDPESPIVAVGPRRPSHLLV
jgi:glycosyltransferase involved in cell wall biosynthesis